MEDFKKALRSSPLDIAINAKDTMSKYSSGIYRDPNCGPDPTHAMTAVGYGTENG